MRTRRPTRVRNRRRSSHETVHSRKTSVEIHLLSAQREPRGGLAHRKPSRSSFFELHQGETERFSRGSRIRREGDTGVGFRRESVRRTSQEEDIGVDAADRNRRDVFPGYLPSCGEGFLLLIPERGREQTVVPPSACLFAKRTNSAPRTRSRRRSVVASRTRLEVAASERSRVADVPVRGRCGLRRDGASLDNHDDEHGERKDEDARGTLGNAPSGAGRETEEGYVRTCRRRVGPVGRHRRLFLGSAFLRGGMDSVGTFRDGSELSLERGLRIH